MLSPTGTDNQTRAKVSPVTAPTGLADRTRTPNKILCSVAPCSQVTAPFVGGNCHAEPFPHALSTRRPAPSTALCAWRGRSTLDSTFVTARPRMAAPARRDARRRSLFIPVALRIACFQTLVHVGSISSHGDSQSEIHRSPGAIRAWWPQNKRPMLVTD